SVDKTAQSGMTACRRSKRSSPRNQRTQQNRKRWQPFRRLDEAFASTPNGTEMRDDFLQPPAKFILLDAGPPVLLRPYRRDEFPVCRSTQPNFLRSEHDFRLCRGKSSVSPYIVKPIV